MIVKEGHISIILAKYCKKCRGNTVEDREEVSLAQFRSPHHR